MCVRAFVLITVSVPLSLQHMLHPCELQALMVGNRVTDWNELEEVYCVYKFTSCVYIHTCTCNACIMHTCTVRVLCCLHVLLQVARVTV